MNVLAPNALTTLDIMKSMLGIKKSDKDKTRDMVIVNLINGVSAWIERMTGRKIGKQIYIQRYDASGQQELVLLQWPILSVDYIKNVTDNKEIDPATYSFDPTGEIGVIYRDNGWPFRAHRGGLAFDVKAIRRVIEVKYTAGYVLPKDATEKEPTTLPYDLQMIVWGAVMQEFSLMQSGAMGLSAFKISDVAWTFDKNPRQEWLDTIRLYARL